MIMSDATHCLLAIRYENRPMVWVSKDLDGTDHFERCTTSWNRIMVGIYALDSPERKQLRNELLERKSVLGRALETNDVSILSRLRGRDKLVKCKSCDYQDTCWNVDVESEKAAQMADKADVLDQLAVEITSD
jgi:hypothetical protein